MAIIRYTTPTIKILFKQIVMTDISAAYLIIKQTGSVIIERDISTAEVTNTEAEKSLSWTMTQEETRKLSKGVSALIYCDWKLYDGTRGRSHERIEKVEDTGKQEVI